MANELEPIEEMVDMKAFMDEITKAFSRLTPEERAYRVFRSFFTIKRPTKKMREMFHRWLMDERNMEAKEIAMQRIAMEWFEGMIPLTVEDF